MIHFFLNRLSKKYKLLKKAKYLLGLCFIAHLFSSSPLAAVENNHFSQGEVAPFVLVTIPKSGSHLIIKALYFMTGGVPLWHTRFLAGRYIPASEGFLYTHFCVSPALERDYSRNPRLKKIVNIRDLRDVCISMISQILKGTWPGLSAEAMRAFKKMSFDEQLLFVINHDYELDKLSPNALQVSIAKVAEQAVRYCNDRNILTCKFENLVGAEGGGTREDQIKELKRIADYLNIPASEDSLWKISMQLHGVTFDPFGKQGFKNFKSTFHSGKIGKWKTAFREEHKSAFKQKLGEALIALGYEKDDTW